MCIVSSAHPYQLEVKKMEHEETCMEMKKMIAKLESAVRNFMYTAYMYSTHQKSLRSICERVFIAVHVHYVLTLPRVAVAEDMPLHVVTLFEDWVCELCLEAGVVMWACWVGPTH